MDKNPTEPEATGAEALAARFASAQRSAETFMEALPWIRRYSGRTMVFKYGGNAMVREDLREAFAADMVFLSALGIRPVVVHGGGPQIDAMLSRLGMESEFRNGLRYTSPETMEVVRMVLTGQVARELVGLINRHGPYAVGISGEDGGLLRARRITRAPDGSPLDLGLVGEVVGVDTGMILTMLEAGTIPVVSSIAPEIGEDEPEGPVPGTPTGEVLNVNADTAAAAVAAALGAEKLIVLTDVEGLYADWPDPTSLIPSLTTERLREMLPHLTSGMIPKMTACLYAVEHGVGSAAVVDGRRAHSPIVEVLTDAGVGTQVVPPAEPARTHEQDLHGKDTP